MKKLLGLALLGSLMFSGTVDAAFYRVDYSGTVGDGTYDGYFTYDTAGLDLNGVNILDLPPRGENDLPGSGFETEFLFNYSFSGGTGSFNETNAGIGWLNFSSGTLQSWFAGGDANGVRTVSFRVPDIGPNDFLLCPECISDGGKIFIPDFGNVEVSHATWSTAEISAVPLPGAVWAFGAGLLGLLGLKRRRKMKMLRTATA